VAFQEKPVSAITILPCAFCGYDDVEIDEIDTGIIAICCPECRTIGPHQDGVQTTEEAIEKWNRRGTVAA
jgi:Lar family restriction alleviation protein